MALWLFAAARAQQPVSEDKSATQWETLEGCRLLTNAVVDGDSFHVEHNGREYIFRLYFVDTPETDASLKERIKDQSAYFGLPTDAIPRVGTIAATFTRNKLSGTNFTIVTRWQNAMGRSSLARFYAIVLIGDENLAEELVANGLARIYGLRANWPDGPRSATFINKLKNLELTAREKKLGVWNETRFAREASTNNVASAAAPGAPIDINTATA
ncbi:MAG TPA: thermonuclease family protein, partial [Verrucomicrobiota bacterium]|nr:thermonuclease family protein [Verrucomicrobiota bacterium]